MVGDLDTSVIFTVKAPYMDGSACPLPEEVSYIVVLLHGWLRLFLPGGPPGLNGLEFIRIPETWESPVSEKISCIRILNINQFLIFLQDLFFFFNQGRSIDELPSFYLF